MTRLSGSKRRYTMVNRKAKEKSPPKPVKERPSIESLVDGSHFAKSKNSCCNSKCNEVWCADSLTRARNSLVEYGPGSQTARKTYVRECFDKGQLHIRDGLKAIPVCWNFYGALMGVSNKLLASASSLSPVTM